MKHWMEVNIILCHSEKVRECSEVLPFSEIIIFWPILRFALCCVDINLYFVNCFRQCLGSGSGLYPDSIRSVDPDPDSES
jgi:hypothetical protein